MPSPPADYSAACLYRPLLDDVSPFVRTVLDVGCDDRLRGAALKARLPGCKVYGLEMTAPSAAAAARLDRVFSCAANEAELPFEGTKQRGGQVVLRRTTGADLWHWQGRRSFLQPQEARPRLAGPFSKSYPCRIHPTDLRE